MIKPGTSGFAEDFNVFSGFTAGEGITAGDAIAMDSDFTIIKASAAALNTRLNFIGFALNDALATETVQLDIQPVVAPDGASLTAGTKYYLSDTNGAIATTAGTYERLIGMAISTTRLVRARGVVSDIITIDGADGSSIEESFTTVFPGLFMADGLGSPPSNYLEYRGFRVRQGTTSSDDGKSILLPAHETIEFSSEEGLIAQIVDFGGII